MNTGENITAAVKVIQQTYENLSRMMTDLDEIANQKGYATITPRFLRHKTDTDRSGWMIGSFIKLYQHKLDPEIPKCEGLRDGLVYGVDVTLSDEGYAFPTLTLTKFSYNEGALASWGKLPSVNEHWGFSNPTRNKEYMTFEPMGEGFTRSQLRQGKPETTYWGLREALFTRFELLAISDREAIDTKVISTFEKLREKE